MTNLALVYGMRIWPTQHYHMLSRGRPIVPSHMPELILFLLLLLLQGRVALSPAMALGDDMARTVTLAAVGKIDVLVLVEIYTSV